MSAKGVLKTVKAVFGNPLTRSILKHMLGRCPHGYRSRLEHALALMVYGGRGHLDQCTVDSTMLTLFLRVGSKVSGGSLDDFKDYARDPAVRRGLALILKGIAEYGVTVPQKLPAPFLIVWNFTNMCNLRCKHCYQRAEGPTPDELTLSEKIMVVDQLDRAGVAAIAFSGGEPTIHPHFLRVASEAASRDIYVSVATNAIAITEEFAEKMRRAGVRYVEVSLDSPLPEEHDMFRGVKGAWERALQGIRACIKAGLTVGVATTVTRMNADEVEDMIRLCEELNVRRVIFFNFIPVGRGADILEWDLTPEEREEVLRTIVRAARRSSLEVAATAPQLARVALSESEMVSPTHFVIRRDPGLRALGDFIGGCGAGRIYAAIQPNGDVTPCVFYPVVVGNLRTEDFQEIWENAPLLRLLRDREALKEPCRSCRFKYVCGGCRARAYAYTGDPTGPDPGCIRAKSLFQQISEMLTSEAASRRAHVSQ